LGSGRRLKYFLHSSFSMTRMGGLTFHARAFSAFALTLGLSRRKHWFAHAQQSTSSTCTSICGEGNAIMYPDAIIQFKDVFGQDRQFGCEQAQKMVESGLAPDGFCEDIVKYAITPCGCVQPDGTPASAPTNPTNPRPTASIPAPAPSASEGAKCPRRRQALDACLSTIENGDDCVSCVTSYYPLFATTCASIDQETCAGLAQCPCGGCLARFSRYIKCLAPQCASQLCQIDDGETTSNPAPAGAAGSSPTPTRHRTPSSSTSSSAPSIIEESERTVFSAARGDRTRQYGNAVTLMALAASILATLP
jgi:hypothetical protein